ncbi:MAG: DUF255 domain-containing protein [bacterium]
MAKPIEPGPLKNAYLAKGPDYQPRTRHLDSEGKPLFINDLIKEDSPYLLQHAHNPVNWMPWGDKAFEMAKKQNKPVFLSIGYATCHWCHVMEEQSFEDLEVANLLNTHFIAIKVDREQYPDIDSNYMMAVQILTGHGGWPMSSFLTTDRKPFYGGTYYPKAQFMNLLTQVNKAWLENHTAILEQADRITAAVKRQQEHLSGSATLDDHFIEQSAVQLLKNYDSMQGGFSPAPKFPQETLNQFLLSSAIIYDNKDILNAVLHTADEMARGGIYDQIGGGFHRYSTDSAWLIPHFEKMLYNQAQLSALYLNLWLYTGNPQWRQIVTETLDYTIREMRNDQGSFYSATDADSEGEEGLFFIWDYDELNKILNPKQFDLVKSIYGVSRNGNFEGHNILHLIKPWTTIHNSDQKELNSQISIIKDTLYKARLQRQKPLTDDKTLVSWNSMLLESMIHSGIQLKRNDYIEIAQQSLDFIWKQQWDEQTGLKRVFLNGTSSIQAIADDYSHLSLAMIAMYDAKGNAQWLTKANTLMEYLWQHFSDKERGGFYMRAPSQAKGSLALNKDAIDGALESGNASAVRALIALSERQNNIPWNDRANETLSAFSGEIKQRSNAYPGLLNNKISSLYSPLFGTTYAANGRIKIHAIKDQQKITVFISIPDDWHINAHDSGNKDLIGTDLSNQHSSSELNVTYPKGKKSALDFLDTPVYLYHGLVKLSFESTATLSPLLKLRLQACSQKQCLPPENIFFIAHYQ